MSVNINADTTNGLVLTSDTSGELKLQANGADIATVTSSGITMASGKSLAGDASSLTNIPAANLTGSLPAGMGGKILQVIYNNTSTTASYSAPNTNSPTTITPLSTSITPTSATSKIVIMVSMHYESLQDVLLRMFRNSTEIGRNPNSSSRWSGIASAFYDPDTASTPSRLTFNYVDSPATTSAITYSVRCQSSNANNYTLNLNRPISGTNTGQDSYELGTSSVILMEVAS